MDSNTIAQTIIRNTQKAILNKQLIKALEIGQLEQVEALITKGANYHLLTEAELHKYSSEHETALHIAVRLGHVAVVQYLLDQNVQVNAKTRRFRRPLHYSAYFGVPVTIAELLLKHGAALEAQDDDGATTLLWAAYLNNMPLVELLLERGAEPWQKDSYGFCPMDWACFHGHNQIVTYVLETLRPSKDVVLSAMRVAAENCQRDTAELLRQYSVSK